MARVLRRTLAIMAALALVLALAGPAAAAKPERVAVPRRTSSSPGSATSTSSSRPLANKSYNTTFFDRDGNPTRDLGPAGSSSG